MLMMTLKRMLLNFSECYWLVGPVQVPQNSANFSKMAGAGAGAHKLDKLADGAGAHKLA